MKFIFLTAILFFSPMFVFSQTMKLNLSDCIKISRGKSSAISIAKTNYQKRNYSYQVYKAGLLPSVDLALNAPNIVRSLEQQSYDGAVKISDYGFYSADANLRINQKIPWTGGTVSLVSGLRRLDQFQNDEYDSWLANPLTLRISQPIFQFNSMAWESQEQELLYSTYDKKYAEDMEDIAIEVTSKFFNYLIAKAEVKNAKFNAAINDTLYILSKGRYSVGKIAENDLLQSEVELANAKISLDNAQLSLDQAREELILYMGLDPKDDIELIPPFEAPEFTVDIDKAMDEALKNRSEITDFKLRELRAERELDRAGRINNISANLSMEFGLNNSAESFPKAYSGLLDKENISLTFSIPLFQWGLADATYQSAKADEFATKESLRFERQMFESNLKYEILRIKQLTNQIKVAAKSFEISQRRFDVAKNRYMVGKIDMNDLFVAQRAKDAALSSYYSTLRSYWTGYYTLRRLTLFDFESNQPLVMDFGGE